MADIDNTPSKPRPTHAELLKMFTTPVAAPARPPFLTISQGGPGATRAEVVGEWQNMVLGGKHGRHDDRCSTCRGLEVRGLISPYTDFTRIGR